MFVSSSGPAHAHDVVRGAEPELAALGYVLSTRLRARLATATVDELTALVRTSTAALLAHVGGGQTHVPLFARFPEGLPRDTEALWWQKVLVYYLQGQEQPCIFCGEIDRANVLDPCRHVVCGHCFDGSAYTACPVCEQPVRPSSPFFSPREKRDRPKEKITFRRLDLGGDLHLETRRLFVALAERTQAMSPQDRDVLLTVVKSAKATILSWLPALIPVRENVAAIFGTLFTVCPPAEVLPVAREYLATATDVLRLIAVISGEDGALIAKEVIKTTPQSPTKMVRAKVKRFQVAKMSRPFRRSLLAILDGLDEDRLTEDMLRHRSYWVWVSEFLHPGEYAKRFPKAASAIQVVRGEGEYRTWNAQVESALAQRDVDTLLARLGERPGELARRVDLLLRLEGAGTRVLAAIEHHAPAMSTPVLLTLAAHLPRRAELAPERVYFPKGKVALAAIGVDLRDPLDPELIEPATRIVEAELLARFAKKPRFESAIIDLALGSVTVPFNERTASRAAVVLPRGTTIPVPAGTKPRLFLHWCEPEGGKTTDLDLSVGFYGADWRELGTCSFYQLTMNGRDGVIAESAGDLRAAPPPLGATELVDFSRERALAAGMRYAVMVVTNYDGLALQPARARLRGPDAARRYLRRDLRSSYRRAQIFDRGRQRQLRAAGARHRSLHDPLARRADRGRDPAQHARRCQQVDHPLLPRADALLRERHPCFHARPRADARRRTQRSRLPSRAERSVRAVYAARGRGCRGVPSPAAKRRSRRGERGAKARRSSARIARARRPRSPARDRDVRAVPRTRDADAGRERSPHLIAFLDAHARGRLPAGYASASSALLGRKAGLERGEIDLPTLPR